MSEILEYLFGSKEKTRLIKFFLQNPEGVFDFSELVAKNMIRSTKARSELATLLKMKFIIRYPKNF